LLSGMRIPAMTSDMIRLLNELWFPPVWSPVLPYGFGGR
jgi:hypothetical protein